MKRLFGKIGLIAIAMMMFSLTINAKNNKLPSVWVKNLNLKQVNTKTFSNNGKPFIILFWATWCKPCIHELKAINDVYDDWKDETGVKIFAISVDDTRNSKKVAPFIRGRGWEYDVYLDENSDFKRAMNVNAPPHSFLFDGKGNLVWQHSGYAEGDEEEMYDHLIKLVKKKK